MTEKDINIIQKQFSQFCINQPEEETSKQEDFYDYNFKPIMQRSSDEEMEQSILPPI